MKKAVLIFVCLFTLLLCGCDSKEQSDMDNKNGTVTVINKVKDADIWILPQTEKNLKTTVWGTATVSKLKTSESRQAPLCEPGDDGLCIFRMIDTDSFYYSANGIKLENGDTLEIKENEAQAYALEVRGKNGRVKNTYDVFSARL